MKVIISLFLFCLLAEASFAQNKVDKDSFGEFQTKAEKKALRKEKMDKWRAKPYHVYLGFDVMDSKRLQPMKFTNKPADVSQHDGKYDGTFAGNLAIRIYLGLMIKKKNCVELSIENFPHEIIFDYKPNPQSYGPYTYSSLQSWALFSACYKRDVFPRSKILKLYPGAFFGIMYVGNRGFLDTSSTSMGLNSDITNYSHVKFYKMPVVPMIGPTLDADVNFWRFTIGLKFRLYWEPWTVWGKDVTVRLNNGPTEKFRIESAVLNFNCGIGLRYTF